MDLASLQQGQKIQDKINGLQDVQEHFNKFDSATGDGSIEFMTNFLTKCSNVGPRISKKDLAKICIESIKSHCTKSIDELQAQFNAL